LFDVVFALPMQGVGSAGAEIIEGGEVPLVGQRAKAGDKFQPRHVFPYRMYEASVGVGTPSDLPADAADARISDAGVVVGSSVAVVTNGNGIGVTGSALPHNVTFFGQRISSQVIQHPIDNIYAKIEKISFLYDKT
jgi:hypothetical protein